MGVLGKKWGKRGKRDYGEMVERSGSMLFWGGAGRRGGSAISKGKITSLREARVVLLALSLRRIQCGSFRRELSFKFQQTSSTAHRDYGNNLIYHD